MSESPSQLEAPAAAPRTNLTPTSFVLLLQEENPGNVEDAVLRNFFKEFEHLIKPYRIMLVSFSQTSALLGSDHPRLVLIEQILRIMDEVSPAKV